MSSARLEKLKVEVEVFVSASPNLSVFFSGGWRVGSPRHHRLFVGCTALSKSMASKPALSLGARTPLFPCFYLSPQAIYGFIGAEDHLKRVEGGKVRHLTQVH